MDAARPAISVVIPAFNESAGVRAALTRAATALRCHFALFEIVLVDDGSTDATAQEVRAAKLPEVRLVGHTRNRGYGAALRTGFEAARFPLVAFTDADGQFDLADLALLADDARDCPVAVGYRVNRRDPLMRRFLAGGYNLLVRALLGTRVRDCDCALKVFRREVLPDLLPRTRRFLVNAEMLTYARQCGHAVRERPVAHLPRLAGSSKVGWRDVPRTFRSLAAFWWSDVVRGPRRKPGATMPRFVAARFSPGATAPGPVLPKGSESRRPVAPPAPARVPA